MSVAVTNPDWNLLYEAASAQEGYFTTAQAAASGYSTHLLYKHILAGRVIRIRRGIYRLVHFPAGEHEDLVIAWLWSEQAGVVSHQSALFLHGLSDVLPSKMHLTLPESWHARRLKVPTGILLNFTDVPPEDRTWFGPVPTTNVRRTLADCAREPILPDILRQAAQQAIGRGLLARKDSGPIEVALQPFGGLDA